MTLIEVIAIVVAVLILFMLVLPALEHQVGFAMHSHMEVATKLTVSQ